MGQQFHLLHTCNMCFIPFIRWHWQPPFTSIPACHCRCLNVDTSLPMSHALFLRFVVCPCTCVQRERARESMSGVARCSIRTVRWHQVIFGLFIYMTARPQNIFWIMCAESETWKLSTALCSPALSPVHQPQASLHTVLPVCVLCVLCNRCVLSSSS